MPENAVASFEVRELALSVGFLDFLEDNGQTNGLYRSESITAEADGARSKAGRL